MQLMTASTSSTRYEPERTPSVLKVVRVAKGLSQRELAERSHVSTETVCRLERGRHQPTRKTANAIASVLAWNVDELFGDDQ